MPSPFIGKTIQTNDGYDINIERWYHVHCEDCGNVEAYVTTAEARAAAKQHKADHNV